MKGYDEGYLNYKMSQTAFRLWEDGLSIYNMNHFTIAMFSKLFSFNIPSYTQMKIENPQRGHCVEFYISIANLWKINVQR